MSKKLFISYRRKSWPFTRSLGESLGKLLAADIFIDYHSIDDVDFEKSIMRHLRECDAFLLIVSEHTFAPERIYQENDWVRREIASALEQDKPIVLALIDGLGPPPSETLPQDIRAVCTKQGIEFSLQYFDEAAKRLAVFIAKTTPLRLKRRIKWLPWFLAASVLLASLALGFSLFVPNEPSLVFDETEVTNGDFIDFINQGGYENPELWSAEGWAWLQQQPPSRKDEMSVIDNAAGRDYPRIDVTWYEADAFCRFKGKRLPTGEEWETAASPDGTVYPWGNEPPSSQHANFDFDDELDVLKEVSSSSRMTYHNLWDMSGNAYEWVADRQSDGSSVYQIRGGSFRSPAEDLNVGHVAWRMADFARREDIGFRCVLPVD